MGLHHVGQIAHHTVHVLTMHMREKIWVDIVAGSVSQHPACRPRHPLDGSVTVYTDHRNRKVVNSFLEALPKRIRKNRWRGHVTI